MKLQSRRRQASYKLACGAGQRHSRVGQGEKDQVDQLEHPREAAPALALQAHGRGGRRVVVSAGDEWRQGLAEKGGGCSTGAGATLAEPAGTGEALCTAHAHQDAIDGAVEAAILLVAHPAGGGK